MAFHRLIVSGNIWNKGEVERAPRIQNSTRGCVHRLHRCTSSSERNCSVTSRLQNASFFFKGSVWKPPASFCRISLLCRGEAGLSRRRCMGQTLISTLLPSAREDETDDANWSKVHPLSILRIWLQVIIALQEPDSLKAGCWHTRQFVPCLSLYKACFYNFDIPAAALLYLIFTLLLGVKAW